MNFFKGILTVLTFSLKIVGELIKDIFLIGAIIGISGFLGLKE